jgi:hypothetical protein
MWVTNLRIGECALIHNTSSQIWNKSHNIYKEQKMRHYQGTKSLNAMQSTR